MTEHHNGTGRQGWWLEKCLIRSSTICLALAGVLCLTGCQQMGAWKMPSWLGPKKPPRDTRVHLPYEPLTESKKADIQVAMGRTAEAQGDIPKAIGAYHDALTNDATRADAYHRLGVLYDKKGDPETAEAMYRQALMLDPQNCQIHGDLGYSLYVQHRWPEAEQELQTALNLRPDYDRAHANYALLLTRTGRENDALRHFHLAGITESQARTNMAFAMMIDQRYQEAQTQLDLAANAIGPHADGQRIAEFQRVSRVAARDAVNSVSPASQNAEMIYR